MITICKHEIYPHCAIVGLPFIHNVFSSTMVYRAPHCSENGVSSFQYIHASRSALLPKIQEVFLCLWLRKRLCLSIHEMVLGLLSRTLIQCVYLCIWTQMACQCEVKRVAWVVKASCLLMSRPVEWMRTQMGFLSGGLFYWPTLSVFGETWKPWLEWVGILLIEGSVRAFTQRGLNRVQETARESCVCVCVCGLGVCWDEVSIMWKACAVSHCSLPFDCWLENKFLDTNGLTYHVCVQSMWQIGTKWQSVPYLSDAAKAHSVLALWGSIGLQYNKTSKTGLTKSSGVVSLHVEWFCFSLENHGYLQGKVERGISKKYNQKKKIRRHNSSVYLKLIHIHAVCADCLTSTRNVNSI